MSSPTNFGLNSSKDTTTAKASKPQGLNLTKNKSIPLTRYVPFEGNKISSGKNNANLISQNGAYSDIVYTYCISGLAIWNDDFILGRGGAKYNEVLL
jgi:hypothetical protein